MAINEKRSYTEVDVTQPTSDFDIGFKFYENRDGINSTVDGVPAAEAGYTTQLVNGNTLRFTPTVLAGAVVRIMRETNIDKNVYTFSSGALWTAEQMDENFEQIRHSQQESRDTAAETRRQFDRLDTQVQTVVGGLDAALEVAEHAAEAAQSAADSATQAVETVNDFVAGGISTDKVLDASGKSQDDINTSVATKLSKTITPFDFGATGDGTYHPLSERYSTLALAKEVYPFATTLTSSIDSMALKKMVQFLKSVGYDECLQISTKIQGSFYLTEPFEWVVGPDGIGVDKTFEADASLTIGFDGIHGMLIHGVNTGLKGFIRITANDRVLYGAVISSQNKNGGNEYINSGIGMPKFHCNDAILFAVRCDEGSMFTELSYVRAGRCGVSSDIYSYGKRLTANVSNHVNQDAWNLEGVSFLTVDTLPPYWDKAVTIVTYNGYASQVVDVNKETKVIKVRPNIPSPPTNGVLTYAYGGVVEIVGSDSASITLGNISGVMCGSVICNRAMYSPTIQQVTSEFCGFVYYNSGLVGGINAKKTYYEGDTWQYLQYADNPWVYGGSDLGDCSAFEIGKNDNLRFGRGVSGEGIVGYSGLAGSRFIVNGITYEIDPSKESGNRISPRLKIDFNKPHGNTVIKSDTINIPFATIVPAYNKQLAYDSQELTVFGSGFNGSPTGNITFTAPTGYTVNGSATVSFNGFTGAAHFQFYLNVDTKNIQIACTNPTMLRNIGPTAQRPVSPPIGFVYVDTTLSPNGKPVWWNGYAWIDMLGVNPNG